MRELFPPAAIVERATDKIPVAELQPPLLLTVRVGDNVVHLPSSPNMEIDSLQRLRIAFSGTEIIPGALSALQNHPEWFNGNGNDVPLGGSARNTD